LALAKKAAEFDAVLKIGRTHLQDATPIRLVDTRDGVEHGLAAEYRAPDFSQPFRAVLASTHDNAVFGDVDSLRKAFGTSTDN
jgi:fumarate hydratase class II